MPKHFGARYLILDSGSRCVARRRAVFITCMCSGLSCCRSYYYMTACAVGPYIWSVACARISYHGELVNMVVLCALSHQQRRAVIIWGCVAQMCGWKSGSAFHDDVGRMQYIINIILTPANAEGSIWLPLTMLGGVYMLRCMAWNMVPWSAWSLCTPFKCEVH